MGSIVAVNTYTHSVTYVTDQMLRSLKLIIIEVGLNPSNFVSSWSTHELAVKTWLESQHLTEVILEVFHPTTGFVTRWDFTIDYGYGTGDGSMWVDTQALKYAIAKLGVIPAQCGYELTLRTKPGRPDVAGWGPGSLRSTEGFIKQGLGTTIGTHAIGAQANYWRKA